MEISFTMLKTFMACEYSYYLRYVKRVKLEESAASVYGTAIHHTIKLAYENSLSKEDMVKVFKNEWITLAGNKNIVFNHDKEYLQKLNDGQKMVSTYFDKYIKGVAAPKSIEIFIGRKDGVQLGGYNCIGVFDQIDANNNIIDYKSGVKPTQVQLDFDLQFTIYSYMYRQLYGEEENSLILRHLGTMKDLVTVRTEEDFALLSKEVGKIDRKIKDGYFVRNLSRDCARCFFMEHCLGKERVFGRRW